MKKLLLILLIFSLRASAQWKENGRIQTWPAIIHLEDSATGKPKGAVQGYVKARAQVYWQNGKIDQARGTDWSKITEVMDINHKPVRKNEYSYYEVTEPGTNKIHAR